MITNLDCYKKLLENQLEFISLLKEKFNEEFLDKISISNKSNIAKYDCEFSVKFILDCTAIVILTVGYDVTEQMEYKDIRFGFIEEANEPMLDIFNMNKESMIEIINKIPKRCF